MNVLINDEMKQFDQSLTVTELLSSLGLAGKPIIVELNKEPVYPRNYDLVRLADGDSLQIVTIAAGG